MSDLKTQISEAVKTAMKAREKQRLATLRLISADIKRLEVDERRALDDADVTAVLNRMVKQRRDSLAAFTDAGRTDLAEQEQFELDVIGEFLPEPASAEQIERAVAEAIQATGAQSMKDMGKVMGALKQKLAGQADMGAVSAAVKAQLNSA